jgi:HEAT repeat protein
MVLPEGTTELWLKALARPEADPACQAAEAVVLAQRRGVSRMETTVPALVAALDRPDQHPAVRRAAARALVALEARQAAPSLLRQAEAGDEDLRMVAEPALARWGYRPAGAVWLARLRDPAVLQGSLVLAIRGLAAVHEGQAAEPLRTLVLSEQVLAPVRLEAARALGELRTAGLEKDAERLAGDPSPRGLAGRLAAAALLRRHKGGEATRLLQRLGQDPEPAVAAAALAPLIDLDSRLVVPEVGRLLASPDAKVRSLAVEVLFRQPSAEHVRFLGDRLDDRSPEVRGRARRSLERLAAKKEFRDRVLAEGMRLLGADGWRGLDQATVLLTRLDHKPAAARLVQLLEHSRPEVFLPAAWGLRKLAVKDTLPGVTHYARARQRRLRASAGHPDALFAFYDHQLSQLNQFLGRQRYGPADEVLREFLPRMEPPKTARVAPECRAAAAWALGLLHEGRPAPGVVTALEGRLNDFNTQPPEWRRVRRMAAVALGRIGAKEAVPSLRKNYPDGKPDLDPVNNASGWALWQITGQPVPAPVPIRKVRRDWFLTPNR